MAKNPILPLYYNDLNGATQDWTDEEFGAYVRLLIYQWDKGFIPSEMVRIKKIADSAEKNWPVLSQKFTPDEQGFLRNSVMEDIRVRRERFSNHQRENVSKRYQTSTKSTTKKTPLENEIENENEFVKEIEMPFTSKIFVESWQRWKDYRKTEFRKTYKSNQSEQSALTHLQKLSAGIEETAIEIINQSIANQWQGLFEFKSNKNGARINTTPANGTGGYKQQSSQASSRFLEKGKAAFNSAIREADN